MLLSDALQAEPSLLQPSASLFVGEDGVVDDDDSGASGEQIEHVASNSSIAPKRWTGTFSDMERTARRRLQAVCFFTLRHTAFTHYTRAWPVILRSTDLTRKLLLVETFAFWAKKQQSTDSPALANHWMGLVSYDECFWRDILYTSESREWSNMLDRAPPSSVGRLDAIAEAVALISFTGVWCGPPAKVLRSPVTSASRAPFAVGNARLQLSSTIEDLLIEALVSCAPSSSQGSKRASATATIAALLTRVLAASAPVLRRPLLSHTGEGSGEELLAKEAAIVALASRQKEAMFEDAILDIDAQLQMTVQYIGQSLRDRLTASCELSADAVASRLLAAKKYEGLLMLDVVERCGTLFLHDASATASPMAWVSSLADVVGERLVDRVTLADDRHVHQLLDIERWLRSTGSGKGSHQDNNLGPVSRHESLLPHIEDMHKKFEYRAAALRNASAEISRRYALVALERAQRVELRWRQLLDSSQVAAFSQIVCKAAASAAAAHHRCILRLSLCDVDGLIGHHEDRNRAEIEKDERRAFSRMSSYCSKEHRIVLKALAERY